MNDKVRQDKYRSELLLNIGSVSLLVQSSQNELLSDMPFQNCSKESSISAVNFGININVEQIVPEISRDDFTLWDIRIHENTFQWWNGCVQGSVNTANNKAEVVIDEKILDEKILNRDLKVFVLRTLILAAYYQAVKNLKHQREILGHGAAIIKNGYCFAFLGESGSGKSTLCQLTNDGKTLNDEVVGLIRTKENLYRVFWTPFKGLFSVPEDYSLYPLYGIFLLNKDTENSIQKMKSLDAALALGPLLVYPGDLFSCDRFKMVSDRLDMCADLVRYVNCYQMHFRKDSTFWNVIRCLEMDDRRQTSRRRVK